MHSMFPPSSSPTPAVYSSPQLPSSDVVLPVPDSPSVDVEIAQLQGVTLLAASVMPAATATAVELASITPTAPGGLPSELNNLILVHAIRQCVGRRDQPHMSQILNVDSVERRTDVARASLTQAWWMNLDVASGAGSLTWMDLLVELHAQRMRPLEYSRGGLLRAVEKAHVVVLEWWYHKRQEGRLDFADLSLAEVLGCINPKVEENKAFDVLKWFFQQHHGLDVASSEAESIDDERRMELVGRDEAKALLLSAAKYGFEKCLKDVAIKVCKRGAHSRLGLESWTQVVSGGHVACAQVLVQVAVLGSELAGKLSAVDMIRAAFRSGSAAMIRWCWQQYPNHTQLHHLSYLTTHLAVCAVVGGVGRCLTAASIGGHLDLIEQVVADLRVVDRLDFVKNWFLEADQVMENGHVHVLEFWQQRLQDWNIGIQVSTLKRTLTTVVARGHAAVLEWWWVNHAAEVHKKEMGFVRNLVVQAAKAGHLDMLDWFVNIIQGNPTALRPAVYVIFPTATQADRVDVLKWWRMRVGDLDPHPVLPKLTWLKVASRAGHLDTLKWWNSIHGAGIQTWIPDLIMDAVREGRSDLLLGLDEIGPLATSEFLAIAENVPVRDLHTEVLAIMIQGWPNELASRPGAVKVYSELRGRGLVVLAEQWKCKVQKMA